MSEEKTDAQTIPLQSDFEREFCERPIAVRVFVQWKGTDVCMDVTCPDCKNCGHVDGYFAYFLRCGQCGAQFTVNPFVAIHRLQGDEVRGEGDLVMQEF